NDVLYVADSNRYMCHMMETPALESAPAPAPGTKSWTEVVELLERLSGPAGDRGQRLVGDRHRQPGLLAEQPVQAGQQRAAADEHQAAVGNVSRELGRRPLEHQLDGVD